MLHDRLSPKKSLDQGPGRFLPAFSWNRFRSALDLQSVIRQIDASVQGRIDAIATYSVNEHYAVFRGKDETHPGSRDDGQDGLPNGTGKTYTTLSESGSQMVRSQVLGRILDSEKEMSLPANRKQAVVTSATMR